MSSYYIPWKQTTSYYAELCGTDSRIDTGYRYDSTATSDRGPSIWRLVFPLLEPWIRQIED
jgi:hypothetical protein